MTIAPARLVAEGRDMTLAAIQRTICAAIRAARKEGVSVVEVKIGDEAAVPLTGAGQPRCGGQGDCPLIATCPALAHRTSIDK